MSWTAECMFCCVIYLSIPIIINKTRTITGIKSERPQSVDDVSSDEVLITS